MTNRQQALLVARRWEAQARAERERIGRTSRTALVRASGQPAGLTQEQIALAMKLSVRAIRRIERRAVKKLLSHPELRQAWEAYLSGQLDEQAVALTPEELDALFGLARTATERVLLRQVISFIQE